MFNFLNELNAEIEKGEEAIAELRVESEKYRGQDKGAASQRKRLIKELQVNREGCLCWRGIGGGRSVRREKG